MEKPEGEDINKQARKKALTTAQQIPSVGIVKLNEFHRTIDAISRFYERTESETGAKFEWELGPLSQCYFFPLL